MSGHFFCDARSNDRLTSGGETVTL